jgi:hypothetical protein
MERDLAERNLLRIGQVEGEVSRLEAEVDSAAKSLAEEGAERERSCTTIIVLSGQLEQAMSRQPYPGHLDGPRLRNPPRAARHG